MRLEELVSDWELDEINGELRRGNAPDIVAFRHGLSVQPVRAYARNVTKRHVRKPDERWTDAELAFVRDNYPNHDSSWCGWKMLKRTWDAIRVRASKMGVTRKNVKVNEDWRKSNEVILGYRR